MRITRWDLPFFTRLLANTSDLDQAVHFLNELQLSRSADYKEYCWGYPFDWVTRGGTIKAHTPFITTTPYVWEAFLQVFEIFRADSLRTLRSIGRSDVRPLDRRDDWKQSSSRSPVTRRTTLKITKPPTTASSCAYSPLGEGGVINAAAYRAFLLTSASQVLENEDYWRVAERNLNFVLENQNPDGSWFYAVDGVRDFVDHFHTCFVMKALAKIHTLTGHEACGRALEKGVEYYSGKSF